MSVKCRSALVALLPFALVFLLGQPTAANAQARTISGTITNASTGLPVANVNVNVYLSSGHNVGFGNTNSDGVYVASGAGLTATGGPYYLRTNNSQALVDQASGGVACPLSSCAIATITPVDVSAGDAAGHNFALQPGGRVSGTVRNAATNAGVQSASVYLVTSAGQTLSGTTANASGVYTFFSGVPAGTYWARTYNSAGLVDQRSGGAPCVGAPCSAAVVMEGASFQVTVGDTTTVDFSLQPGGTFSGTIRNATTNNPIASEGQAYAYAELYNSTGRSLLTSGPTNANGEYSIAAGVPPGTYFMRTWNHLGFINVLHSGIACVPSCTVTGGTALVVPPVVGNTVVDFALSEGGTITGTVTGAGGAALPNASVQVVTSANVHANSASTNALGVYTITGLPAGTYFARTSPTGYVGQLYNGKPYSSSTATVLATADPIAVTAGATTGNINFALVQGGTITGTVTGTAGALLQGRSVSIYNAANVFVTSGSTNASGVYTVSGLPAGTYFARTFNSGGYFGQVYNGKHCPNCNPATTGDPITVVAGATQSNIDFALLEGGQVTGTVTDSSGTALSGITVNVRSSTNSTLANVRTGADGTFTATSLEAGTVFLRTTNTQGYLDQMYNGLPCLNCSPTSGTPVTVNFGATTSGINFSLTLGGRISGTVTNASTGAAVSGATVGVYNSFGSFVGSTTTNASGVYESAGVPTGSYFARVISATGLIPELYNDIVCVSCPASLIITGTPIVVTVGQVTSPVDFALAPGGSIAGTVRDANNQPVASATISVVNSANSIVASGTSNAQGQYVVQGLPSDTYYVRTNLSSLMNYIGQVYAASGNLECQSCDATTVGSPLAVVSPGAITGIDFALQEGGRITGTVETTTGAPVSTSVQVHSTTGTFIKSAFSSGGTYTVNGLAGGSYLLRTNTSDFVNQVYGGSPCDACTTQDILSGTPVVVTAGATTPGINFALAAGTRITGTVTDGSGAPIQSVNLVLVSRPDGSSFGGFSTNAAGEYQTRPLVPGTYFARTTNTAGFVNQIFDGIACVTCPSGSGTPIVVSAGGSPTANFQLSTGGRISGTVTDAASGLPIVGANVQVYSATGSFITSSSTNDAGAYTSGTGLLPGTYYVRMNATGYVPLLWPNVPCPSCSIISGGGVAVVAATTTTGIDAALSLGGRVSGRVTNTSGSGLQGVSVQLYNSATGGFVTSTSSNATGAYVAQGLPAGSYVARTFAPAALGVVNQLFDGIECATCSATTGTAFVVVAGGTTPDINFVLQAGGRIGGTVRGAGNAPIPGVGVQVFTLQGQSLGTVNTDANGAYVSAALPAGGYYVRTTGTGHGYINQLYDGIACRTCSVQMGTRVDVTAAQTRSDVNFSLVLGGTITGTVRDGSSTPVSGVTVQILDISSAVAVSVVTNTAGEFSAAGLSADTYYARTTNALGLVNQIYNGTVCLFCSATLGTPIPVTAGATVSSVDFTLQAGGAISGTVIGPGSVALEGISVQVYGASGELIQTRATDAFGQYGTTVGLPAGNYFVRTSNSDPYIDEVYNNILCVQCNALLGTAVVVTGAGTTTGVDFALTTGAQIAGTVLSSTGPALEGVTVQVFTPTGTLVATGETNANGQYRTSVLAAGTYYLRTQNALGYTNQLYDGRECTNCNPTTGTPVVVATTDVTGIDFALPFGGRISGTVTAVGGVPISGVSVQIFTSAGVFLTSGSTNALGQFTTQAGLQSGTYYARTSNGQGYVDETYSNLTCVACAPTVGLPIVVSAGVPTTGIDFELVSGGRIAGTITDETSGSPIPTGFVNIYSSTGAFVTQAVAGSSGQYITGTGLAPGNYFARAASRLGYISKVWNNFDCAACSAIIGTPIEVTADTTTGGINFALVLGGKLSGTITDATTGAPLRNVTVYTFNTANSLVTTAFTDAAGHFVSASGLPVGTYYVRTINNQGYVDQVYAGATCLGCTPNTGTGVVIGAGGDVAGIDFALITGGRITGVVTESTTGLPLSGLQLHVVDSTGKVVGRPATDSAGGYATLGGLPAGTYYVHTASEDGYINRVYNNIICEACDPRLGTPVVVAEGGTTSGINFSLGLGGGFSGRIIAGDTSQPLGGVEVSVYTQAGSVVRTVTTDGAGDFSGSGLPAGTYFLRTFNLAGYVDEAYDDQACAPCDVLASTQVVVPAGGTVTGRDFTLARGGLVSGYVTDSTTNAPLEGVTVSFYVGALLVGKARPTDENGYYAISLPVGTYTAVTDAVNGYATPNGQTRRAADGPSGSVVSVALGQETGGITFGLAACTPPAFSVTSLTRRYLGVAFSDVLTATGGTGNYTYSVVAGGLAPGVSLDGTTGTLSGTPTVLGTANFTLGVTDGAGCSATSAFAQTIDVTPTVNSSTSALHFAATKNGADGDLVTVTSHQVVTVSTAGTPSPQWTATADQPWVQIASGAGSGAGSFTIGIINPGNVLGGSTAVSATITLASAGLTSRTIVVNLAINLIPATAVVPPIGIVDTPSQAVTGVRGAIAVTGWALDNIGVAGVKIYRNCLPFDNPAACQVALGHNVVELGDAAFLPGARPDVEAVYTTYPDRQRAGWGFMILTSMLPHIPTEQAHGGQGTLSLYAVATDLEGNRTLLGRSTESHSPDFATPTTITLDNDSIAQPFGTLDTPAQGETVSGMLHNFGWALTPDSNTTGGEVGDILIPTDGSTVTVLIDNLPVAQVTYNLCRGNVGTPLPAGVFCNDDVANVFGNAAQQPALTLRVLNPTLFRNLDAERGAIGAFSIDTTTLTNGPHSIYWTVTDSSNRTSGIGSRFFTVLNTGTDVQGRTAMRVEDVQPRGPGTEGVWSRSGFSTSAPWAEPEADDNGTYHLTVEQLDRLEVWLGAPVSGSLWANGAARPLPVGSSLRGALFTWAPPAGYVGPYTLVFLRGSERVTVVVTVK